MSIKLEYKCSECNKIWPQNTSDFILYKHDYFKHFNNRTFKEWFKICNISENFNDFIFDLYFMNWLFTKYNKSCYDLLYSRAKKLGYNKFVAGLDKISAQTVKLSDVEIEWNRLNINMVIYPDRSFKCIGGKYIKDLIENL